MKKWKYPFIFFVAGMFITKPIEYLFQGQYELGINALVPALLCYLCLFIYIKAREKYEPWAMNKETTNLIHNTINELEDKQVMKKLIDQFEKINYTKQINE